MIVKIKIIVENVQFIKLLFFAKSMIVFVTTNTAIIVGIKN